jgi:hypothetical protein
MSMHVGQPKIPTGVAVGQSLVIKAHQPQNRGVKIVNVHAILDRFESDLISGTDRLATFHTAAS